MPIEIKLPELGDGIDSGDVLEVLVREGDMIAKEQGLVELETDKATVEVPSSQAGKVVKVHVERGETVKVGAVLVTLEAAAAEPSRTASMPTPAPPPKAAETPTPPPKPLVAPAAIQPPSVPAPVAAPAPAANQPAAHHTAPERESQPGGVIPAGPAIRRFAREVGVDLSRVTGTAEGGRITREDVLAVVRQASHAARTSTTASTQVPTASDAWGPIRYEKLSRIRKTIAAKMHESWTTVPRVTNFDDADITRLEYVRQSSKQDYAQKGIKLTAMPFVIKSVAMALKEHPTLNATLDPDADQIIFKEYVNIGIAVDSERGLVVPSLRHADKLSIPDIARSLAAISEQVRTGNFSLDDLRGSTFTISNLGAIGGTYSTPIVNVPEVAILLLGRSRKLPVVVDDKVEIRLMMPLSLSYDHRLVDGAAAARFLNEVIEYLEAPSRLLLAP